MTSADARLAVSPAPASGSLPDARDGRKAEAGSFRILTLSTVFPNPHEPDHGTFIRQRMLAVAGMAQVKVIAPVAAIDYSNPGGRWFGNHSLVRKREDGPLEISHPRWLFPPFGTPLNAACLYLRLLAPIARLRREYPFDVLDAHFGYPDGVAAALLASRFGCPFTVTLRGNERIFGRSASRRKAMAAAFRRAARILAVSEELRRYAVELGAHPDRTRTIPNGVDADFFYPRERELCRSRHGIAAGERVILSAGRLVEAKGHHYIIRALAAMRRNGVEARLLVAGAPCREDRFEQELRRIAADQGIDRDVEFLGHVSREQLAELMSAADMLCLASFAEGWPNVVHEAQACGLPVIATAVGGVPDMIPADTYGYIVPVKDEGALAAALSRALARSWDRDAISAWGRSRSWKQVAGEVVDELRRAAAEHASRR